LDERPLHSLDPRPLRPRPAAFFSNSPLRDSNFAYPDDGHDFPTNEREESYRFIERWLE
jgi:hypothetical protein